MYVRQKYGDPRLGSAPLAMEMEDGTGTSGISLFGNLGPSKEDILTRDHNSFLVETCARDTSHLNSAKTGPMYGESGFYRDTRHLAPSKAHPGAYSEGFFDAKGKGPKPDTRPSYSKANQQLVDIVGEGSVFQGISGLGRFVDEPSYGRQSQLRVR